MADVVEINERGEITIPSEALGAARPHTRYVLETKDGVLMLRPEGVPPFWETASPEERAKALHEWVAELPEGPGLPDQALHRDSMYE